MSSLKDLKAMGASVPDELVKVQIKFKLDKDGDEYEADIHIRRMSIGNYEAIYLNVEPDQQSQTARLLSEAVRLGEHGEERISYAEAYQFHPRLAAAMMKEVSRLNGGAPKN